MSEWLYEEGIGENRAILVEGNDIIEAAIELPGELRAGAVQPARLTKIWVPGRRGLASLDAGGEALVEPLPAGLTEGAVLHAEIVREPIPEPGRPKRARVRATDAPLREGASLAQRIGRFVRPTAAGADRFEQAGWSELLEQAMNREIPFAGGALRMSVTPAMTLFDVDGGLPPAELARAGAAAAARAIRRLGIGGSIGIDLPTLPGKAERQAAAAEIDAWLPPPFERTAVNGFGFLQIVRRRERPSLPELLQADPAGAAARALLRRAERAPGSGPVTIEAAPAVIARIEGESDWRERLRRLAGAELVLRAEAALPISGGHVQRSHS
ncbi:ribonuclease [Sphingosinicella terrae]|uniref:ribonuclease n=1 Tax=Sphingosinicella terrae TaxID=2172047 RepID=UPI000E0D8154|nr:ribonuclease [Sphingosinicella terrae]